MSEPNRYDITYKAFRGAWMQLTGTYTAKNKELAIKLFNKITPNGEIISIYKMDKYGLHSEKLKYP